MLPFARSNAYTMVLPKLIFVLFCDSIPFSITVQVMICGMHVMASVRDLGKCSASKATSYVIHCLECFPEELEAK